jgi:hypothetical protein
MFIAIKANEGRIGIETEAIKGFFYEKETDQLHLWMGESEPIVVPSQFSKALVKFLTNNIAPSFYEIKNNELEPITRNSFFSLL